MADNITVKNDDTTTVGTLAADDISSVLYPRSKITLGADGTNDGDVSSSNPMPVKGTGTAGTANAGVMSVQGIASMTPVQIADNGGSITVDGTVAVSGTVTVDGSGVTQPVSHAALTELAAAIDTEVQCDIVGALPAGSNAIGKLAANNGVDIGDVDVTSVIPGTGATNLGKAVNSAVGMTDTGIAPLAVRDDALSTIGENEGNWTPLRVTADGALWASISGSVTVGSHAVTNAGTFAVQVDGTALTRLTDIETNTDSGAVVGNGAGATAQRVTLANDSTGIIATVGAVTAITNALPAGTNAIGKLAANSGVDIGDVDVTSVPVDPFGANADAASATGSISAKLRFIAATGIPITGTVTVGAHAVTNAGTFAVQESGTQVVTDDAAFTPGTTKVVMAGFEADETATDSVDEGDGGAARMTLDRKQIIVDYAHTAGGCSSHTMLSTAAVHAAEIKGSPGQVYAMQFFNLNAAARYVRLYNQTGVPATTDTANIVWRGFIPGNTAGAGFVIPIPKAIAFSTGIGIRVTAAVADNDATVLAANEIVGNVIYK